MPLESSRWFNRSVSIERGPLVFALDVQSEEHNVKRPRPDSVPASAMHRGYIEYHPIGDWNYGIPENTIRGLNQQIKAQFADTISLNPWTSKSVPVQLTAYGLQLPQWRLDRQSAPNPPLSPVEAAPDTELHPIRLIPYGATTLRIAEFAAVSGGPASEKQGDIQISASHVFEHDSLLALHDGRMDRSSRHTFWPRRGTSEWLQYSFDTPRTIRKVIVYWYDDTGRGECRTPESWRLLFRDGDKWQPVRTSDRYATASQEGNTVTFTPITTSELRVEVKLRADYSAGVRELEFD